MEFKVFSMATEGGLAESKKYEWQGKLHGMVGFDGSGKHALTIPGHDYGKERIRAAVEELLH